MDGGYHYALSGKLSLIKDKKRIQGFSYTKKPEVFDAVTRLQNTGFRINKYVYASFSTLFSTLKKRLMSAENILSDCDESINRCQILLGISLEGISRQVLQSAGPRLEAMEAKIRLLQLSRLHAEAAKFLDKSIYFVHCCDFRGRIYPQSSLLNIQGDDLNRNLMDFAEGKTVSSPVAKRWLAIHGANCYAEKLPDGIGLDKASFEKRVAWVGENKEKILALGSVNGDFWSLPNELEQWWLKAEEPWAFLAWARGWFLFKKDPATHQSHLPVAVDGSCNGYQHLAAMLRSTELAKWVNLSFSENPHDVYTHVSERARVSLEHYRMNQRSLPDLIQHYNELNPKGDKKIIYQIEDVIAEDNIDDIENNTTIELESPAIKTSIKDALWDVKKEMLAVSLLDELPRKAVKKVIMTYPFSATLHRMAAELEKMHHEHRLYRIWSLKDADPDYYDMARVGNRHEPNYPVSPRMLSFYLARLIRDIIDELFPSVAQALAWFQEMATSNFSKRHIFKWTMPTGLIVLQDYKLRKKRTSALLAKDIFTM